MGPGVSKDEPHPFRRCVVARRSYFSSSTLALAASRLMVSMAFWMSAFSAKPRGDSRAACRHHHDRSGAGRNDAVDAVTVQLELPGRAEEQDERVVSQGRLESLIGGLLTVAERLQAHPLSEVDPIV